MLPIRGKSTTRLRTAARRASGRPIDGRLPVSPATARGRAPPRAALGGARRRNPRGAGSLGAGAGLPFGRSRSGLGRALCRLDRRRGGRRPCLAAREPLGQRRRRGEARAQVKADVGGRQLGHGLRQEPLGAAEVPAARVLEGHRPLDQPLIGEHPRIRRAPPVALEGLVGVEVAPRAVQGDELGELRGERALRPGGAQRTADSVTPSPTASTVVSRRGSASAAAVKARRAATRSESSDSGRPTSPPARTLSATTRPPVRTTRTAWSRYSG